MSDLELLTGPQATGLLETALGSAGGRLLGWRATQVDHRPGRGTTVAYSARVAWADREQDELLGASTGVVTDRDGPGVQVLSDGAVDVAVWRVPLDPGLPALPTATDPAAMRAVLEVAGVDVTDGSQVALVTRSYRPRRRAVVEVRTPHRRLFAKVVPPDRAPQLHHRHRLLTDAGVPVPASLGWREDGLVLLEGLPGSGLRARLRRAGPAAIDVHDLVGVLDALPSTLADLPARASWSDGAAHYASVIAAALPREAIRAHDLATAVVDGLARGEEPVVAVHGDFYEAQVLVDDGRLTGVLDVDSAGPGRRGDDLGCLLAHAEVLAQIHPPDADRLRAAVASWTAAFERDPRIDPRSLRLRTAGVLLSLATGPHRVQQVGWEEATSARLDLVERWVGSSS
jgi:hypothetical protein